MLCDKQVITAYINDGLKSSTAWNRHFEILNQLIYIERTSLTTKFSWKHHTAQCTVGYTYLQDENPTFSTSQPNYLKISNDCSQIVPDFRHSSVTFQWTFSPTGHCWMECTFQWPFKNRVPPFFSKKDNYEIAKIHYENFKIFFSRITGLY